jgi:hypothetical protein
MGDAADEKRPAKDAPSAANRPSDLGIGCRVSLTVELATRFLQAANADRSHLTLRRSIPSSDRSRGVSLVSCVGGALLHAHEIVLKEARTMARRAAKHGDDGTNDLIVSDVIRANELQVWFVAEHVVNVPLANAV